MAKKSARQRERQPPLNLRVTPFAQVFIDGDAKRNGRSRNAEATEWLEARAMQLASQKARPKNTALQILVREAIQGLGQWIDRMEESQIPSALTTIKGEVTALLDELGAGPVRNTAMTDIFDRSYAMNAQVRIAAARALLADPGAAITPADKELLKAAELWGLKPAAKKENDDGKK